VLFLADYRGVGRFLIIAFLAMSARGKPVRAQLPVDLNERCFGISFMGEKIQRRPDGFTWDSWRLNLRASYGLVDGLTVWGILGKNQVVQTYSGEGKVSLRDRYRNSYGFGFSTILHQLDKPSVLLYLGFEQMKLSCQGQVGYPTPLGQIEGKLISDEDYQWWELHPYLGLAYTRGDYTFRIGLDGYSLLESRYVDQVIIVGQDTTSIGHKLLRSAENPASGMFIGLDRRLPGYYWLRLDLRYTNRLSVGLGITQTTPNYKPTRGSLKKAWPRISAASSSARPYLVLVPTNESFHHGWLYAEIGDYSWQGQLGYPRSLRTRLILGLYNVARVGTSIRPGFYPAYSLGVALTRNKRFLGLVKLPDRIPSLSCGVEGHSYGPAPRDRFQLLNGEKAYLQASWGIGRFMSSSYLQDTELIVGYGREVHWRNRYPRLDGIYWGLRSRYNLPGSARFIYSLEYDGYDYNFDFTCQFPWGIRIRIGTISLIKQPHGRPEWYLGMDTLFDISPMKKAFGYQ